MVPGRSSQWFYIALQTFKLTRQRFENTYPGIRCDIPSHVYQSGFAPNTQWTEEFAQGPEIRAYWQGVARKYDVYKYLRLEQKVEKAEWLTEEGKWKVTVRDLGDSHRVSTRGACNLDGVHDYTC